MEARFKLPSDVPTALVVLYKSYSRQLADGSRETYDDVVKRTISGLRHVGGLFQDELDEISGAVGRCHAYPSGRALWVAGTEWSRDPRNVAGYYNCTSTEIRDVDSFGLVMDLSMMGCGTGTVLEPTNLMRLPPIRRKISISNVNDESLGCGGDDQTRAFAGKRERSVRMQVGDSRKGWVDAFLMILRLAFNLIEFDLDPEKISDTPGETCSPDVIVEVDLSQVRPVGSPLRGFGGVANPSQLGNFFIRVAEILRKAYGRRLTSAEVCLILDEAASVVVAGNIRRSAGLRQFSFSDLDAADLKRSLYTVSQTGEWSIDSSREAMRLSAHTRIIHHRPTLEDVIDSVKRQFETGEGAIQYASEAVARCNSDLLSPIGPYQRSAFIQAYEGGMDVASKWLKKVGICDEDERYHRLHRYGLNPCGEIIGYDFFCNLSEVHLNMIDPSKADDQRRAFYAAGIMAGSLLGQRLTNRRYRRSRELDPIVGVSFTGLFDFFVHAFGLPWLEWMMLGRKDGTSFPDLEREYLVKWRKAAWDGVRAYCLRRDMQVPSRVTAVQPAGTKSLFTGASPGWHPPKAIWYVRRIVFPVGDAVALACREYGYRILPTCCAYDDSGNLVEDITNPRYTECMVEIPMKVAWADVVPEEFNLSTIPARSQWGLYMAVQTAYTDHNTSGTIEIFEQEISEMAELIYGGIGNGYVSCTLTARLEGCFPMSQMPIQPITKKEYDEEVRQVLARRISPDFVGSISRLSDGSSCLVERVEGGCDCVWN